MTILTCYRNRSKSHSKCHHCGLLVRVQRRPLRIHYCCSQKDRTRIDKVHLFATANGGAPGNMYDRRSDPRGFDGDDCQRDTVWHVVRLYIPHECKKCFLPMTPLQPTFTPTERYFSRLAASSFVTRLTSGPCPVTAGYLLTKYT